ncbi:MAG: CDP-diacylglycerol--glycerol-3-phosphate 3-phosphatidyltransferase [Verrucomicrobiales bacterium]|nr:CDP-diacylglycerol--glycerol-3-phosphate 3-phosphatidyltransferase [Verrucomicrobiales bacterium]
MTTANKITLIRILLVPFFITFALWYVREGDEWFRFATVLTFGLASISDGLDGYIARHYNQRSELGAILDPLADKLLLIAAIILLSFESNGHFARIPLWLIIVVLSRDVLLVLGLSVIYYMFGKVKVRPRVAGKIGTVFQMCVVVWILLKWDRWGGLTLFWLEVGAALFTGLSGLLYIWDWIQQLSEHPSSGPTKP